MTDTEQCPATIIQHDDRWGTITDRCHRFETEPKWYA